MTTPDQQAAAALARAEPPFEQWSPEAQRHLAFVVDSGVLVSRSEFAKIEACERHVPTAEERQAYREAVERYDAVAGGPGWDAFVRQTMEQRR